MHGETVKFTFQYTLHSKWLQNHIWRVLGKEMTVCTYFLHHVSLSASITAKRIFIQFHTVMFY